MSFNLTKLPEHDRQRIELTKQAHLLCWRMNRKEIGRAQVVAAIEAVDEEHREWFRQTLNQLRRSA